MGQPGPNSTNYRQENHQAEREKATVERMTSAKNMSVIYWGKTTFYYMRVKYWNGLRRAALVQIYNNTQSVNEQGYMLRLPVTAEQN